MFNLKDIKDLSDQIDNLWEDKELLECLGMWCVNFDIHIKMPKDLKKRFEKRFKYDIHNALQLRKKNATLGIKNKKATK